VVKGATFILGWLISLAIVVAITMAATGNQPPKSGTAPSLAALAVKIAIGAILVGIAVRQQRRMGRPKKPKKTPKWQAEWTACHRCSRPGLRHWSSRGVSIASGVATIIQAKVSSLESALTLIFFCLLSTASYLTLAILVGFRPEKGQALLTGVRTWMDTHTDQVIIVGCLVPGFWLIGHNIYLIVT
jgi:hypothetical protein